MTDLSGLSLLLVEDEYLIALDTEQMLRDLGAAEVDVVGSFDDAHERAKNGRYDLAVLDVNINGKLSLPIAEALRAQGVPLVFATGYGRHDQPLGTYEGSVCLGKPYTTERLRRALAAALNAKPATV
jgi:CheY-like chemotaxis protein